MVYLGLFLAILCMGFMIWRDSVLSAGRRQEIEEFRDLREDLSNARDELQELLLQLEKAADSAVDKLVSATALSREETGRPEDASLETGAAAEPDGEPTLEETAGSFVQPAQLSAKSRPLGQTVWLPGYIKGRPEQKTLASHVSPPPIPAKHQQVYALAEQGHPVDEIAQKLNVGKGEVSLILQLKKKLDNPE